MVVTRAVAYNPKRWSAGIEKTMPAEERLRVLKSESWIFTFKVDTSLEELRYAARDWAGSDPRLAMSLTPGAQVLCLHRGPEGLLYPEGAEASIPEDYPFFWRIAYRESQGRIQQLSFIFQGTIGADLGLVRALVERLDAKRYEPLVHLPSAQAVASEEQESLLPPQPQVQAKGLYRFTSEDRERWQSLRRRYPLSNPILLASGLLLEALRAISCKKNAGILYESFSPEQLGPQWGYLHATADESSTFEELLAGIELQRAKSPSAESWAVVACDDLEEYTAAQASFALRLSLDAQGNPKALLNRRCAQAELIFQLLQIALRAAAAQEKADYGPEAIKLYARFNQTERAYPHSVSIPDLLKESFHRFKDSTALEWETGSMSYAELDRASDTLAHHLMARGIGRGDLIGLGLPRDESMLVSLLAILKSGAGYVPLDPSFPPERIRYMAEHSRIKACLCDEIVYELTHDLTDCLRLDELRRIYRQPSSSALPQAPVDPEDIAYVIYTSGSTGLPKGVMLSHRSVINFLLSMREAPGMEAGDKILAVTTLSFDIAVLEIYLPLLSGGSLYLASIEQAKDGIQLAELLDQQKITHFQATASTYRLLLDAGWKGRLKKALCGGEAFPLDIARRLKPHAGMIWNMYGPTETTVWSSIYRLEGDEAMIPIGRPIANSSIFILDEQLRPLFPGHKGEIYIGGSGLALGYLNRPDLTAERFLSVSALGQTLYKTGDIGSIRWDGTIEIFGRSDGQIKLRGYRMELGEIEAVMSQSPNIGIALAAVRDFGPDDRRLVAYLQVKGEWVERAYRQSLRSKLPSYMLPQHFVVLEQFPLLPNGKIDRKALPHPANVLEEGLTAPSTQEKIPLTTSQARMLYVDAIDSQSHVHNLIGAWRLSQGIDDLAFRQALFAIVREQEAMRMSIRFTAGSAEILLNPAVMPKIESIPLPSEAAAKSFIEDESKKPLDLQSYPNFRIGFVELPDQGRILYLFTHHVFWDGFSYAVFWKLLQKHYGEALSQGLPRIDAPAYSYSQYTRDQSRRKESRPELARYWLDLHRPLPPVMELVYDQARPEEITHAAESVSLDWDSETDDAVLRFAKAEGATAYHVLLSAYFVLLQRLSQQHDLVVGTPVLGRQRSEVFDLLGNFINALALRLKIPEGIRFRSLLQRVKGLVQDAMSHADYPIESLVADLKIPRDPGRTPLYSCMFFFQDHSNDKILLGEQGVTPFLVHSQTVDSDLVLWIERHASGTMAGFNFRKDLWRRSSVVAMAASYKKILREFLQEPDRPVEEDGLARSPRKTPERIATPSVAEASIPTSKTKIKAIVLNEAEAKIVKLFQSVLGPGAISPQDSFFDAGGHSLLALKVLHLLETELGLKLRIRDLLLRNVAQLAHDLSTQQGGR